MIRIGVCQWSLDVRGVAALARAAQLGFAGIQLGLVDEATAAALKEPALQAAWLQAATETGVEIIGFGINALNNLPLHSPPDSEVGRRALQILQDGIDIAVAMDVGLVYCPSFMKADIRTDEELARASAMLRRGCDYIDGRPLLLATENGLDAAGHLRIIEQVDHPALRVLVDGYNPVRYGHYAADLVRELPARYLCNQAHAKDGRDLVSGSAPLGRGDGRFVAFVHALKTIDFEGWLISENNYDSNADELVAADLATLADLLGSD